jgi:hypothetical protein
VTVLAVCLLAAPAGAVVDCAAPSATADADNDGFTDAQECAGIGLAPGNTLLRSNGTTLGTGTAAGAAVAVIPRCAATALVPGSLARQDCVDPDSPDLFIMLSVPANSVLATLGLNPATGNRLPMLDFLAKPKADGGLGLALHRLAPTAPATSFRTDRRVMPVVAGASTQKAVKMTESLTIGNLVGFCQWGTPNTPSTGGQCTVYTAKIRAVVQAACPANTVCALAGGADGVAGVNAVVTKYIRQAFAHEAAHAMLRTNSDVREVPQHHLASESNAITEEFEVFKVATSGVTWYISDDFSIQDQVNFRLK